MIVTRKIKLVVSPRQYESITIEAEVTMDSAECAPELTGEALIDRVQSLLEYSVEADVAEAAANVAPDVTSFINDWRVSE